MRCLSLYLRFGGAGYNGFERLTLVPIQTKMMDTSLLTKKEVDWIDGYHAQVQGGCSVWMLACASCLMQGCSG